MQPRHQAISTQPLPCDLQYLSSPAATTLHGKMHGFVLRLPPQHKPHATFMQPSQCILQHDVANPHVSTQMATPDDNNQAAIPMRSATTRFKRRIELRTQTQPLVAEHRGGTNSRMKRPQPHPPHTGGTFHRRLQPLYTEKCTVSCSDFLPNTSPMQRSCSHHNAFCSMMWLTRMYLRKWQHQMTTIRQPFQCDLQPQDSRDA